MSVIVWKYEQVGTGGFKCLIYTIITQFICWLPIIRPPTNVMFRLAKTRRAKILNSNQGLLKPLLVGSVGSVYGKMKYDRPKTADSGNSNLIMKILLVCLAVCSEPSAFSHMYVLLSIHVYQLIELQ